MKVVGEFCIEGIDSGRTELAKVGMIGSGKILFARNGKAITLWGTPGDAAKSGETGLCGVAVALDALLQKVKTPKGPGPI